MALVTCHTSGCANNGATISLPLTYELDGQTYVADTVVCGVCGHPITDVADESSTGGNP